MGTLQPELAAQLRFQASLIRLCSAPHMAQTVRPEQLQPATQPQAAVIEELAILVPVRVAPRADR
jgi:hypothetical protein